MDPELKYVLTVSSFGFVAWHVRGGTPENLLVLEDEAVGTQPRAWGWRIAEALLALRYVSQSQLCQLLWKGRGHKVILLYQLLFATVSEDRTIFFDIKSNSS